MAGALARQQSAADLLTAEPFAASVVTGPSPSEVPANLSRRLKEVAEILGETCRQVEPDVLRLGHVLDSVHREAGELTARITTTVNLVGGESGEGGLKEVGPLAESSLVELGDYQSLVRDNLGHLRTTDGHLGRLEGLLPDVERIARFVRVVALNIAVESSRSARAGRMFHGFSQEIGRFAEKVLGIAQDIRRDSRTARARQLAAHDRMSQGVRRLDRYADEASEAVRTAIAEIERLVALSTASLDQAGLRSRAIAGQVGEVVVGIQFHDNVSQRADHVITALKEAGRLCDPGSADEETDRDRILGAVHSLINIQAAQLAQIVSIVETVHRTTAGAFDEITVEVSSLADGLSAFGDRRPKTSTRIDDHSAPDPFVELKSALKRIDELTRQGRDLVGQMSESATAASRTAAGLSDFLGQLRQISEDVQLMAINALINTVNLGDEGRCLGVLSEEVDKLSRRSDEFVAEVEVILGRIDSAAAELQDKGRGVSVVEESTGRVDDGLARVIENVSRGFDRFRRDSARAHELAEELQRTISRTRDDLRFLEVMAVDLSESLQRLEGIGRELSPWAGLESGAVWEELSGRYTMQRERDIHDHVVGRTGPRPGRPTPGLAGGEVVDEDGLGDNIELF